MSATLKFLIGLFGLILLAYAAFFTLREPIRIDLTTRTAAALKDAGQDWASISFATSPNVRNRIAVLSGIPPADGSAQAAVETARALYGVHDARFEGDATALPSPFVWRADRARGELVLSGNVPSEEIKEALYRHSVKTFEPTIVVDKMTVASGAPDGDWLKIAMTGLDELKPLDPGGYALLSDKALTVLGTTRLLETKTGAEARLADLPDGYAARPVITLDTPAPPVADPCEARVEASIAGRTIGFATGKAELTGEGRAVLDDVASVLGSCPATAVRVEGHTDSRGEAAANLTLSQARADAVVAYLAGKGVASGRMTARGFGEDRPLDPAQNAEAWAKNRRIAFAVTTSQ